MPWWARWPHIYFTWLLLASNRTTKSSSSSAHWRTLYTQVEDEKNEHLLITHGVPSSRPDTCTLVSLNLMSLWEYSHFSDEKDWSSSRKKNHKENNLLSIGQILNDSVIFLNMALFKRKQTKKKKKHSFKAFKRKQLHIPCSVILKGTSGSDIWWRF